jgi:hypothetical protein
MKKGFAGYIKKRKIQTFIKMILEFTIVAALFVMGIVTTGDRLNLLTVVAILGCLPASKAMVEWIMILPHQSIAEEKVKEIEEHHSTGTKIYDLVLTSEKNIMPLECILICGQSVYGYTTSKKTKCEIISNHITKYLYAAKYTNVKVFVFDDFKLFLKKINSSSRTKLEDDLEVENQLKNVIVQISL